MLSLLLDIYALSGNFYTALFSWTNLAQKDGYLITLEIISKMLGVQRIADGEALEVSKDMLELNLLHSDACTLQYPN